MVNVALSEPKAEELLQVLMSLPESRMRRGIRHDQTAVLALAICAVLGGARSYVAIAEWAQRCNQNQLRRLGCRRNPHTGLYEPPSEPTRPVRPRRSQRRRFRSGGVFAATPPSGVAKRSGRRTTGPVNSAGADAPHCPWGSPSLATF